MIKTPDDASYMESETAKTFYGPDSKIWGRFQNLVLLTVNNY